MAINVKLLRKIEKYITEEPRRLNMVQWGAVFNPGNPTAEQAVCNYESRDGVVAPDNPKNLPPCGTVGCIAGTAWLLNQTPEQLEAYKIKPTDGYGYSTTFYRIPSTASESATEALGLVDDEASRLFYIKGIHDVANSNECWPAKYAKRYIKAKTPKQRAKVTVERIEHFIKTKGRE